MEVLKTLGAAVVMIFAFIFSFLLLEYINKKTSNENIKAWMEKKLVVNIFVAIIAAILLFVYYQIVFV